MIAPDRPDDPPGEPEPARLAAVLVLLARVQTAQTPEAVRRALREASARGLEPSRHVLREAIDRLWQLTRTLD